MFRFVRIGVVAALACVPMMTANAAMAAGAPVTNVPLPFDQGEAVRIIQGYNGGTHQGASVYGLDLVLASGETSGAPVLAPFDGSVPWAFAPGEKTGCIEILASDGRFGAMLCHVILDRPFGHSEKVSRGQQLGTVGAPGMVGNNGTPHVHMELHVGGRSSDIVPFSPSNGGLPLDGWDLPFSGATNEHGGEGLIISTNASSAGPAPLASKPVAAKIETHCAPNVRPALAAGFATMGAALGDAFGTPMTCEFADPSGSGDVLQQTSNGLAFWRKSTNTPTFTDGARHWAFTSDGVVQWTGASVDPPAVAIAGATE